MYREATHINSNHAHHSHPYTRTGCVYYSRINGHWYYLSRDLQSWHPSSNSDSWYAYYLVPNPCYIAPEQIDVQQSRNDATHVTQHFINTGGAVASHYKMIDNVWYYWSEVRQIWKLSTPCPHRVLVPINPPTPSSIVGSEMLDELVLSDINPEYDDSIKFRRHLTDISVVFTSEGQNAGAALISKEKATELRDFLTRWIDS